MTPAGSLHAEIAADVFEWNLVHLKPDCIKSKPGFWRIQDGYCYANFEWIYIPSVHCRWSQGFLFVWIILGCCSPQDALWFHHQGRFLQRTQCAYRSYELSRSLKLYQNLIFSPQTYLKEFQYNSTIYTDLWKHLQMVKYHIKFYFTFILPGMINWVQLLNYNDDLEHGEGNQHVWASARDCCSFCSNCLKWWK